MRIGRNFRNKWALLMMGVLPLVPWTPVWAACRADSGLTRAALVENFRSGPRGRRSSGREARPESNFVAPTEFKVIEVHVPERLGP